jgi:putative PIN family toxin of toxin-antitoxin system
MRVILDTNILISALLVQSGPPGKIYRAWSEGAYSLLTCQTQLDELRHVLARPAMIERIRPHRAGRLVNNLKNLAILVEPLPHVERSPDPEDDFLLAAAEAGKADFLVTGDKSGLLSLAKHHGTRILTAADFAAQFL